MWHQDILRNLCAQDRFQLSQHSCLVLLRQIVIANEVFSIFIDWLVISVDIKKYWRQDT